MIMLQASPRVRVVRISSPSRSEPCSVVQGIGTRPSATCHLRGLRFRDTLQPPPCISCVGRSAPAAGEMNYFVAKLTNTIECLDLDGLNLKTYNIKMRWNYLLVLDLFNHLYYFGLAGSASNSGSGSSVSPGCSQCE